MNCGQSAYNSQMENPHILEGAIVGDPSSLQDTWEDSRYRPDVNQPYVEQNAGWQSAIAGKIPVNQLKAFLI